MELPKRISKREYFSSWLENAREAAWSRYESTGAALSLVSFVLAALKKWRPETFPDWFAISDFAVYLGLVLFGVAFAERFFMAPYRMHADLTEQLILATPDSAIDFLFGLGSPICNDVRERNAPYSTNVVSLHIFRIGLINRSPARLTAVSAKYGAPAHGAIGEALCSYPDNYSEFEIPRAAEDGKPTQYLNVAAVTVVMEYTGRGPARQTATLELGPNSSGREGRDSISLTEKPAKFSVFVSSATETKALRFMASYPGEVVFSLDETGSTSPASTTA